MKLVINTKAGGFDLSKKAMNLYAEKVGFKLYPDKKTFYDEPMYYWTVDECDPKRQHYNSLVKKHKYSYEERLEANKIHGELTFSAQNIKRNDPKLVEVVEELGDASKSMTSNLKIVEIPDDVDWYIDEGEDGSECVAEKHRTWS